MFIPFRLRYFAGALGVLVTLLLIFEYTSVGWLPWSATPGTPIGSWAGSVRPSPSLAPQMPSAEDLRAMHDSVELRDRRRANAVFVVLARNIDLWELTGSMKQVEDRFNHWAGYDWVFLNDGDFSDEFKKYTQALTRGKCTYGKIDPKEWNQPDWIDEERAKEAREEMTRKQIIYGHSVPYRNMCRYNSGDYDYYWRVEPGIKFLCDINYDPFLFMQDNNKVYGFTVTLIEYIETIPTLWEEIKDFVKNNPELLPKDNAMSFLSDDGGETYNRCHFWSNFEIGDLRFWRGEAYMKYFEHLDRAGGFYYERWGDAPVHSIGAALLASKDQLHWFDDIGYRHEPFQHCPIGEAHERGKCYCDPQETFDGQWFSCVNKYTAMFPDAGRKAVVSRR